jgi:hypothetical protein
MLAEPHAFAVWAARSIEITSEHVARVTRVSFERIGRGASTALAEFATIVVSVAWVIIPTRIEVHIHLRRNRAETPHGTAWRCF